MRLKTLKRTANLTVQDQHSGHKWSFRIDFMAGTGTIYKNGNGAKQLDHVREPVSDAWLLGQIADYPNLPEAA